MLSPSSASINATMRVPLPLPTTEGGGIKLGGEEEEEEEEAAVSEGKMMVAAEESRRQGVMGAPETSQGTTRIVNW